MNTAVSATGMNVKAKAESGIVIANEDTGSWTASASAKTTTVSELLPTSTANGTNWYHSKSEDANDANAHQGTDGYTTVSGSAYYVDNLFYIKSATETAVAKTLYIKEVKAEVSGTSSSSSLNKTLRVGVKVGTDTTLYIFAPVDGATLEYYVGGSANKTTAYNATVSAGQNIATAITSIPTSDNGLPVHIFVWFEGEDASCVSDNVTTTLDQLVVSVSFTTEAPAATPTVTFTQNDTVFTLATSNVSVSVPVYQVWMADDANGTNACDYTQYFTVSGNTYTINTGTTNPPSYYATGDITGKYLCVRVYESGYSNVNDYEAASDWKVVTTYTGA